MNRWTRLGCRAFGAFASLVMAALLVPASACSVLVAADREQCENDADCVSRGAEFADYQCVSNVCERKPEDPTWACLGKVTPPTAEPRKVTVTVSFLHLVTRRAVPDVSAQICEKFDIDCTSPIITGLKSGADGTFTFQVDAGFSGYATFQPPGLVPGSYFFYPVITEDRIVPPIPLIDMNSFVNLAQQTNIEVLAERGHVLLAAYNCKEEVSAGIQLSTPEADPSTRPFYIIGGLPKTTATETDSQGWAGVVNLLPGAATIFGKVPALNGAHLGKVSVLIKPGQLTYTALHPSEE